MVAFKLKLEAATLKNRLDLERHYLEKAAISRHDHKLEQADEQAWEQRNEYKKQVNEKEVKIARLRSVQFHAFSRAKALEKLVWKLVDEAKQAEARARKILVEDQQALEELPHTLD